VSTTRTWQKRAEGPVYLHRVLDDELDEKSAEFAAISIEGPKAVGKTETAQRRANTDYRLDGRAIDEWSKPHTPAPRTRGMEAPRPTTTGNTKYLRGCEPKTPARYTSWLLYTWGTIPPAASASGCEARLRSGLSV